MVNSSEKWCHVLESCIRSIKVKVRIRCGAKFTECIHCTRGVKQGDVCSPALFFAIYQKLALWITKNGKRGVSFISFFLFFFLRVGGGDCLSCYICRGYYLII